MKAGLISKIWSAASHPHRFFVWEKYRLSYLYRWVLPRMKECTLAGVHLDVRFVSLRMKDIIRSAQYESCEVMMCDKIITPTDRILELGSAIGFIGIYCLKNLNVSDVYSVEANPDTVNILIKNYALNGLEPKVLQAALSDKSGPLDFFVSKDFFSSSTFSNTDGAGFQKISVNGMLFRDICKTMDFECTAMIVDVEGAERFIDPSQIPVSVRKLVIELHPEILGTSEMFEYLVRLSAVGFRVVDFHYHSFALIR